MATFHCCPLLILLSSFPPVPSSFPSFIPTAKLTMATTSRAITRGLRSKTTTAFLKTASLQRSATVPRQAFQQQARRGYASSAPKAPSPSSLYLFYGAATAVVGGTIFSTLRPNKPPTKAQPTQDSKQPKKPNTDATISASHTPADYRAVYSSIAAKLIDESDYDDGSYAPILLRLGWHCSGTYSAATGTGGSNGATMRFDLESKHGANSGLVHARDFLEPVKERFSWITYSDLWTLAAVCAVARNGWADGGVAAGQE